jgi:putative DNA methylase
VTSVAGLDQASLLISRGGKVRLLRPQELQDNWEPTRDSSVWEMTHQLIRLYHVEQRGEQATAELLRRLGPAGETARDLAYRLFNICEKKKFSQEAQGYNALVLAWPEIARLAQERRSEPQEQKSWL